MELLHLQIYYWCNPSGVEMSFRIVDPIIGATPPVLIEFLQPHFYYFYSPSGIIWILVIEYLLLVKHFCV